MDNCLSDSGMSAFIVIMLCIDGRSFDKTAAYVNLEDLNGNF